MSDTLRDDILRTGDLVRLTRDVWHGYVRDAGTVWRFESVQVTQLPFDPEPQVSFWLTSVGAGSERINAWAYEFERIES